MLLYFNCHRNGQHSVIFVLAFFKTLCPADHDHEDHHIPERRNQPLPAFENAPSGNENTGPESYLAEIVRAAAYFIQTVHGRFIRGFQLGSALLPVCNCLEKNTGSHDRRADPRGDQRTVRRPFGAAVSRYQTGLVCTTYRTAIRSHMTTFTGKGTGLPVCSFKVLR